MASQVQAVKALFEKHSIENVSAQIEEITEEINENHRDESAATQVPSSDEIVQEKSSGLSNEEYLAAKIKLDE